MEFAIAGTVISVVGLAGLFSTCIETLEIISSAAHFGVNQEVLQVKAEVERVRLLVWGQSVGIASSSDDGSSDGGNEFDEALEKEYIRSAVAGLLVCFIKIFDDVDSLKKKYGLTQEEPAAGLTVTAGDNSSEPPILASVFQRTYAQFQENAAKNQKKTSTKRKAKWAIVDENRFRALIGELKGINDSLNSLLPGVQQRSRVQMRSEIMRSNNEQQLQSLMNASEDVNDVITETASLRLEMLSSRAVSRRPVPQPVAVRAATPITASEAQTVLPSRPANPQSGEEAMRDSSSPPAVLSEPAKIPYNNTGALIIHNVFARGGCLACFTWLAGIDSAPELSVVKPASHPSLDLLHVPDSLYPISSRLLETDVESDSKYAGWAPASVSVSGFGREFTQFNGIDHSRAEKSWVRASPTRSLPLQTIVDRWREITKYGLGQEWTEEKGREQVSAILGRSELTWIDPNENIKIRHQISDLLASLSRVNAFPNLETLSSIGMLAVREKIDPSTDYHLIDFMYQILQAKEISLRLLRDKDNWHGGVTVKVLYDMIAAELWMKNLEESKTGGFEVLNAVKDSQMYGMIHLAEELQWPYLSEVRELAHYILGTKASKASVDIRVWDWMMGLILPGGFFAISAFFGLHSMSRSIKDYPPTGNVKVRRPEYGFAFPTVTYWRSRSIVGRVLAPSAGIKDIGGWVGPCPAVSNYQSPSGTLIDLKCRPPSYTLQEGSTDVAADSTTLPFSRHTRFPPTTNVSATSTTDWEEPIPPPPSTSPCELHGLRLTVVPADIAPGQLTAAAAFKTSHLARVDFQLLAAPQTTKTMTLYANSVFIAAPPCRRPTIPSPPVTATTTAPTTGTTTTPAEAPQPKRQNHRIDPKSAPLYSRRVLEIPELMSGAELKPGFITVINATAEGGEVLARAWCAEKGCCAVIWKAPRDGEGEEGGEGGGGCFKCALMVASKEGLDVGVVICC